MKIRGIVGNRSARRAGAVWGVLFLAAAACGPAFPAHLEWGTYLGGSGEDSAQSIALDGDGNLYVAGTTDSVGWVSGGWDATLNVSGSTAYDDAFLVKLTPTGAHVWSTYLGGWRKDGASAVALDGDGNILIVGYTGSAYWVSGGWDTLLNYGGGADDGYLVKLSPAGVPVWSTYLGGGDYDRATAVAVDADGNVLVAGYTWSDTWVSGGWDVSRNELDGFAVKLSPEGAHLWSTFLGSSGDEIGYGITADMDGNVLVVGKTDSSGWVSGGWDTTGEGQDGFLVKLSSTGTHAWSTFLGGEDSDEASSVAVDNNGNVLVCGSTKSPGWVSDGAFTQPSFGWDGFVARFSASGGHEWSSYFGGADNDYFEALALDAGGDIYVTGNTGSPGWVSGGWDTFQSDGAGTDCFVLRLSAAGDHVWSSYVGGGDNDHDDHGLGVAVAADGAVVLAGKTESSLWFAGGYDETYAGSCDGFVVKSVQTAERGALRVALTPPEAVAAGVRWRRVGAVGWRGSGELEEGVHPGAWRVEFQAVPGWVAPPVQAATVTAGETVELSAAYTDNRGALRVTLTPPEAVAAGARWRRVGTETWLDSGAVEAGVPAGACQVEFQEVAYWVAPSVQTATVAVGGTTELTAAFLEAGSIRVVIAPEEVVLAGAQWRRIGTTAWHSTGAEVITPAGDWQVEYKTVAGWIAPSAQPVTVAAGATSDLSAAYTDNRGALRVVITPAEAVAAGARWRRTGTTPWFDSGATETAVPAGSRQVEFMTVTGWIRPSTRSVTVSAGATAELAVSYTYNRGALHVTITPPEAVAAGAQWRRKGTTTWRDSGTTETSVSAGNWHVEFKLVTGWAAPTQPVTVTVGATAEVVGVYAPAGSLRVTITPDTVLPAGAQWRRVGTTTWRDSGFVETALPPGDYQVEFKGASGWTTPPAQPVTVTLGETAEVAAAYVLYGGLQVWITPAEAVAAGAQWRRVGTTTWRDSGHLESALSPGDHQVEFKAVSGWVPPAPQPVTVAPGALAELTAAYTDNRGVLRVTITPPEAVSAGALWRRVGTTAWRVSGTTETAVPAGDRRVEFNAVAGWIAPPTQTVTVVAGATADLAASYSASGGALRVTIAPPEAVAAGAQWRRVGTTVWFDSGVVESSVYPGDYQVEFQWVYGWIAPPTQPVTVAGGATAELAAEYTAIWGALRVTIAPPEAVAARAQWRRVGTTTWRDSGYLWLGMPAGDYQVEFKTVSGWIAPPVQSATVMVGTTTELAAEYAPVGGLRVTIMPAEAVAAGAQWKRVGTSIWRDSGALESNISAGDWQVQFRAVSGWIAPSTQPVTVTLGETVELAAAYTDNRGGLRVTLTPPEAVAAGAQWKRVGTTTWRDSGAVESLVVPGDYQVEFKTLDYWAAPPVQTVTVAALATVELTAAYAPAGALRVAITPEEAVASGAKWRFAGESSWRDSGSVLSGLPVGEYVLEFNAVPGWIAPGPQTAAVTALETAEFGAQYVLGCGLRVTITPSVAVEAGARWRRVGTMDWLPSGATEDVSPGTHEVEFREVPGCVAPPSRTVDTPMGAITPIEAVYQYTPTAWGTYLSGGRVSGVAIDGAGNVLVAQSTDYQSNDYIYVAKFSPTGEFVWNTDLDVLGIAGIATAPNGDVVFAGFNDTNTNGWKPSCGTRLLGGPYHYSSAFLVRLSSEGALLWSNNSDDLEYFNSVAVDNEGAVYVVGTDDLSLCEMVDDPICSPYCNDCRCYEGYVSWAQKYSATGVMQWTFRCSSNSRFVIGQDGGLYLSKGACIERLNPATGETLPNYGICAPKDCSSFAVDADGNIFVMRGDSGGEVSGGWRTTSSEEAAGVLEKYGPDGSRLWSTYLNPSSLALDAAGNVYAAGTTRVPYWLGGGADANYNGYDDGSLVKLSPAGAHLWSTYLGGSRDDRAYALCVGGGHVHVGGYTESTGWLQGGWDTTTYGSGDGFLLKLPAGDADPWTIQATLTPPGVVAEGARWRLTSDTVWRESGDSVTGVFPGECRVVFKEVDSYYLPPLCMVPSAPGTTVQVVGEYGLCAGGGAFPGTYLGGAGYDAVEGVATDTAGNIYVAGTTASSGWVSGGWDTVLNGGVAGTNDAFVVKLSSGGAHLWSTYLGGTNTEYGRGIAVDDYGNVVVAGYTNSPDWVSGGWDTVLNDGVATTMYYFDAFAAKLSPEGAHLWSTYLGGAEEEYGYGIAVDVDGNVIATGYTKSPGWVSGGWDTVLNTGTGTASDAFAVKLAPEGTHLWSTYLGGGSEEYGFGIAVDGSGNVYATGRTYSAGWVSGGWDTTQNGGYDGYVVQLTPAGTHAWSTYLGGTNSESGYGIAVDAVGNVFIVGETNSSGWVSGGWNTTLNVGGEQHMSSALDAFAVKLSPEGAHLWSTFMGGGRDDSAASVVVKDSSTVYVTGYSKSQGWVSGGPDTCLEDAAASGWLWRDAFVVALDAAGPHRWSTFLGGGLKESGKGIALTGNGGLCIAGETESGDWLTGGWDESYNGDMDGFVVFLPALEMPPAPPTDPGATAIGADTITWTWVDHSSDETGFNVWADPGADAPVTLQATTAADAMAWTQGGLPVNSLHTFQVAATNADGDSPRTAPFPAWTLAITPAAPMVGNPTGATLDVAVDAGDGNPAGTEYALRCVTTGQWVQADGTLGETAVWQAAAVWGTVAVSGLAEATEHTFEALARNGAGVETAAGPTASGVTLEMVPPTAAVTLLDPTPTQAAVLRYGVIFSEPVAPTFTVDDVALTGGLTGTAAVDGADPTYTVTVTLTGVNPDGLTGIAIGTEVQDAAGNGFAGAVSPQYDVVWWPGFEAPPAGSVLGYAGDPGPVLDASVAAGAPRAAACQWWRDDGTKSVVAGPATAVWDLGTLSAALDGVYWCSVAYGGLTLTTAPVEVRVRDRIALTAQPTDQTIVPGGTAVFTVSAAGGYAPLHYQWRRNGENAPDSPDAAAWTLENVTAEQAGAYSVVVSDSQSDTEESGMAVLKVESNVPAAGLLGLAALAGALALAGRRRRGIRR